MSNLRFLGDFPFGLAVGLLAAVAAWFLYRRELQHQALGRVGWWLPALRSLAVFLIVMMLTEPTVEHAALDAEAGRLLVVLDDSQSMSVVDASSPAGSGPTIEAGVNRASRFERAAHRLLEDSAGIGALAQAFDLTVLRAGTNSTEVVWRSKPIDETHAAWTHDNDLLEKWRPSYWTKQTKLGDVLRRSHAMLGDDLEVTEVSRAIVLMTDGQSNAGESPLVVARALGKAKVPIFTIGFGPNSTPPDLAVVRLEHPESVFRSDTLQGKLHFRDSLPTGTPFQIRISRGQDVFWQSDLKSTGVGARELEFAFSVESVIQDSLQLSSAGVNQTRTSVELQVELIADALEVSDENNHRTMYLTVVTQRSRILLLDGRSRWETRYVKNLFARDSFWQLDALILTDAVSSGPASEVERFVGTREALMEYNLVILGDVPAQAFSQKQLGWLREYVEQGGGLIVVDGARGNLRAKEYASLNELFPVRWLAQSNASAATTVGNLPKTFELTTAGIELAALQITAPNGTDGAAAETASNLATQSVAAAAPTEKQNAWNELPPLNFVSRVEELVGSEILVNAVSSLETTPLFVSRRYGAGRVLFIATDETWRWRYKVADRVHARLWNQLARWVQRQPLSISNEFLSLDSGAARVAPGEPVEIRCRLRDATGKPAGDRSVMAVIQSRSGRVARLPMVEQSGLPGSYQASTAELPEGVYRATIEAEGFTEQSLSIHTDFAVESPVSQEMLQLACDTRLLQQIAQESRGQFLAEAEFDRIHQLLRPTTGGRITRSVTILWQSYWWFSVVVSLLIAEWIVRKRTGLV